MERVIRSVAGVVVGIIVGLGLASVIQAAGQRVFPLPAGADPNDPRVLATQPPGALLILLLALAIGAFAGGWLAARVARRAEVAHGLVVGVLLTAVGAPAFFAAPFPTWFRVAGCVAFLPLAFLGAKAAQTIRAAREYREATAPGMTVQP